MAGFCVRFVLFEDSLDSLIFVTDVLPMWRSRNWDRIVVVAAVVRWRDGHVIVHTNVNFVILHVV